jgi:transposase
VRGSDDRNGSLFSYVDLEARVPTDHPLRVILRIADEALDGMSAKFDACYARIGRPSIAPERLMRALLLQAFYSIRSEHQLMERLEFDLLFRWFVGLGIDDRVWDAPTFSKNRDRLLEADAAAEFLSGVVSRRPIRMAVTVTTRAGATPHATGVENAARTRRTPRPPIRMPGSTRRRSARRAGSASWRPRSWRTATGSWWAAASPAPPASPNAWRASISPARTSRGAARWPATRALMSPTSSPSCASAGSRRTSRRTSTTPAPPGGARPSTAARPATPAARSQRARKRVEEVFGWLKTVAGWRKTRFRGLDRSEWGLTLALAAYNLTRMPKLLAEQRA